MKPNNITVIPPLMSSPLCLNGSLSSMKERDMRSKGGEGCNSQLMGPYGAQEETKSVEGMVRRKMNVFDQTMEITTSPRGRPER